MTRPLRLLVVDDDQDIRNTLSEAIRTCGHEVQLAKNGEAALHEMRHGAPDVLLTDLYMEGIDGLELLSRTHEYYPNVTPVLMTARGSIDSAVSSMRSGAYDYLLKPLDLDQLEALFRKIEKTRAARDEERQAELKASGMPSSAVSSRNFRMGKILETARKVAVTDSTILIMGESGTGKTLLARLIHDESARAKGPFAVVNCATLSENLLESELFGHVRGSFTGAIRDKVGRLEAANGGTVFLDEIGEISPGLQTKLLRFLQEREFEKVGDTRTIRVDVRILAATNQDLDREVREGRFREDLYFRLNVIDLHMPSLRERPEDLDALIDESLRHAFELAGRPARPLSATARKVLHAYPWPGNIRELKNALERAAILCSDDEIVSDDLPERVAEFGLGKLEREGEGAEGVLTETDTNADAVTDTAAATATATDTDTATATDTATPMPAPTDTVPSKAPAAPLSLDELERLHIERVLAAAGSLEQAAATLGINLSTLWRKRRLYGMN